ncbi:4438_t:CDS:2 [Acaulospora morrowiae]|uniref:4438_t:CDS:1 n=1 Tax=Acaulospora morrowiae TaxID=94023 RepID=A0A9N9NNC6_9GLOM|nr:4438_t:CDS:2 [Acaulospora morrowiae]
MFLNESDHAAICRKKHDESSITQAELIKWHFTEILAEDMIIDAKQQRKLIGETLKIKAAKIVSHLYPDKTTLTFSIEWL